MNHWLHSACAAGVTHTAAHCMLAMEAARSEHFVHVSPFAMVTEELESRLAARKTGTLERLEAAVKAEAETLEALFLKGAQGAWHDLPPGQIKDLAAQTIVLVPDVSNSRTPSNVANLAAASISHPRRFANAWSPRHVCRKKIARQGFTWLTSVAWNYTPAWRS